MIIVAIAWLYVVLMMAITSSSFLSGLGVFVFYGLLPLTVVLYLMGAPQRWKARRKAELAEREAFIAQQETAAKAQSTPTPPDAP
jgi:hypothetical protein